MAVGGPPREYAAALVAARANERVKPYDPVAERTAPEPWEPAAAAGWSGVLILGGSVALVFLSLWLLTRWSGR